VFSWTVSLFVVPVVVVVDSVHGLGIVDHVPSDWWVQVTAMSIVVGLTALVLETVALQVMRRGRFRERLRLAALVFAFSTSAWSTASRSAWQHGPSMLCLTVGLWALLRSERRAGAAALAGRGSRGGVLRAADEPHHARVGGSVAPRSPARRRPALRGRRYELARGGAIGHDPTPDDGGVDGCLPYYAGS
jgi:hypothetical protein